MLKINTVTILGANGNMGSLCGGLIAAFGDTKVFMVARTINKANEGIVRAIDSVKSDVIKHNFIPLTYDNLSLCIPKSDWIIEACTEDINVKYSLNHRISKFVKPKTIISTTTSSLSITNLAAVFDKDMQSYYFGTHFFNPPYKRLLCEVIPGPNSARKIQNELAEYLEKKLIRQVIICRDLPAFVANRIAFEILNKALIFGQKYGIEYIDYLLGGITGRVMPPLRTIDFIGLDIYKEIAENMGFRIPLYVNKLICAGKLGNKTGSGIYGVNNKNQTSKRTKVEFIEGVKEKIREGKYKEAISVLINSHTKEAKIIQYFFAKYIQVSFSMVNTVTEKIEDVDKAMAYGYNWLPPSVLIDLIGDKHRVIDLLNKFKLDVPVKLLEHKSTSVFYTLQNILDYRSYLRSI